MSIIYQPHYAKYHSQCLTASVFPTSAFVKPHTPAKMSLLLIVRIHLFNWRDIVHAEINKYIAKQKGAVEAYVSHSGCIHGICLNAKCLMGTFLMLHKQPSISAYLILFIHIKAFIIQHIQRNAMYSRNTAVLVCKY